MGNGNNDPYNIFVIKEVKIYEHTNTGGSYNS